LEVREWLGKSHCCVGVGVGVGVAVLLILQR